jgi:energy-coupling factor transporter ATP-binding protein EcfA2
VRADIAFGPKNMGLDDGEINARVREAAALVGLAESELDKSPFDLSGGQKRRAAIAGVMAMRPEVLVLDEPAAGLDPRGRDTILAAVRNYNRHTGATVIIVSHSMEDMASYCDDIVVMSRSKVFLNGTRGAVGRQNPGARKTSASAEAGAEPEAESFTEPVFAAESEYEPAPVPEAQALSEAAAFARAVISTGIYRSIWITVSATWKKAPELPATRIVETPAFSYRSRIREMNGVIGSLSPETTRAISSSRTMKFVALVSSSMSRSPAPASTDSAALRCSTTPTSCCST